MNSAMMPLVSRCRNILSENKSNDGNKRKNCTNFVEIAQVGANVTSFSNTGVTNNTEYRYRVRAFNANGNSAYSNIASAKTPRR